MNKKVISGVVFFIFCVIVSFAIQLKSSTLYNQAVAKIDQVEISNHQQEISATKMNGKDKGDIVHLTADYRKNELDTIDYSKGEQVFYSHNKVDEKKRDGYVFFMIASLLFTLIFVGGKSGVTTFISVVLNSAALFLIVNVYRSYTNLSLVIFTAIYTVLSIAITLFLIDGIKKDSLQKFFATLLTVFSAFFICFIAMEFFQDEGLRFEDMGVLTRPYRPIFLSGLLVGAIGASLDTVVSVVSTLEEIERKNPAVTLNQLVRSGKRVGQDVSSTMVNVLICSYFSSAIPMMLVYLHNGWLFGETVSMLLSLEVVRVLCGGFGILLSIPFSLLFFQLSRRGRRQ
ncbi:YibE/F family protein [Tetragenococcus halophilus]|uniref:YibE/F family protein n=2 Tax=Tetragenococcus halophilus TaxID=51669 RepID=A0AB35HKX9_TETHA|nr:YibE/F family protein [Tetragenococcus halophilus]MCO7026549.1 YibE/F family protein [Tetragenococcus halophilus]MCO8287863.1 YibE/F family protein [Tetragenococcus halophilus]MCO8296908.1 YibE/F family protein [Tetragenococcus halophilus]MDN6724695.1 YibE/F family protein [Tetragenococcus halophilus]GEQ37252.1 membrane protein [Tetragenococcus halophilus]